MATMSLIWHRCSTERRFYSRRSNSLDENRKDEYSLRRTLNFFPGRLTAGHQVLVLIIGVRIPAREPRKSTDSFGAFSWFQPGNAGCKLATISASQFAGQGSSELEKGDHT